MDKKSESQLNPVAVGRRQRAKMMYRRLHKAIRVDDRDIELRLKSMNIFSVVLVILMILIAVILFVMTESNVKDMGKIYGLFHWNSVRNNEAVAAVALAFSYIFSAQTPEATEFLYSPHVHSGGPNNHTDIVQFDEKYFLYTIATMSSGSVNIEKARIKSFNNNLPTLRTKNSLEMEEYYGGKISTRFMSIKEAFRTYSALGQRIVRLVNLSSPAAVYSDFSYWWFMSNGIVRLRDASFLLTKYLFEAFAQYRDLSALEPVYFLIGSLFAMIVGT